MLDNTRLRGELAHIQRVLSVVSSGPRGKELIGDLRRGFDGTVAALLWQSLFADCLRVAYSAAAADGKITDDEVSALYEFLFSAARHYATVLPQYREFLAIDEESTRQFLAHYASDNGSFGERATLHWPGLTLCRRASDLGEPEPLERYERMMTWLIPAACEIGSVTEADPRWSARVAELHGLRRTLAKTAAGRAKPAQDPRVQAFLGSHGVFAAVAQASSVFDSDPFDVEKIHHDVRQSFEQLVDRAASPSQHGDRGRMLLILGESGSGKTHLLRGFRRYLHEYGRGFAVYAQMSASTTNYVRYLLHHVVDSLSRPYSGPSGEQTGLRELAIGLARLVPDPLRSEIEQLAEGAWTTPESLRDHVNRLVDDLLQQTSLPGVDPDLLRVMLYALYPDQRTISRADKYLRCEDMSLHDRLWLGDVQPRLRDDDPKRMIQALARLMFLTRQAALVLMVDQAELSAYDATISRTAFTRMIDALLAIVSEVPTAIAVIACLRDLYDEVRPMLTSSIVDRLEKDPPREHIHLNRSYNEIEAIVGSRLSWLYAQAGVAFRPEQPVFPIPEEALRALVNRRTRDILQWCHQYQLRCAAAKKLLPFDTEQGTITDEHAGEQTSAPDITLIAAAWNDATHATGIEVPDTEEPILALLAAAAQAIADENDLSISAPKKTDVLRLKLSSESDSTDLVLDVTNRSYHRGAFGNQLEELRRNARGSTPVAVRTLPFPRGPASEKAVAQLLKAGGRRAYIDEATLRTLVAWQNFHPAFSESSVTEWKRRDRPISSLAPIAEMFDLVTLIGSTVPIVETVATASTKTPPDGTPIAILPEDTKRNAKGTKPNGHSPLRVGKALTFGTEPKTIDLETLCRHTGILGSSGSGKTTLALNLIEQALERDIAVVLVDRKGDLAGYAKPDWWQHTVDPERAKKLAERIDVRLFTPGTRGGRPLSLVVVPDLRAIPEHERDRMVQYSANALAAMMHLGNGANDSACRAILTQSIAVLAERKQPGAGLSQLLDLLEGRDDQLLARAGRYDDKLFKKLIQSLETVRISDADLFDSSAEPLTAETLIGRKADGKVPLAIASTRFLGEIDRIQSWVAHLIGCLNRYAAAKPRSELHTLFMIDEADLFMPAGAAKPPSKEPLQDLLKRARAAGLGVVLASQSPADFDYRSREQINTWFLGRISEQRSIDKMKPLFEQRPAVAGKLGVLHEGHFVMLQAGGSADLDRTPSLLRTEQLAEQDLMTLAAKHRSTASVAS